MPAWPSQRRPDG